MKWGRVRKWLEAQFRRLLPLLAALRSAAQWRLLLIWVLGMVLPTLVAATPAWRLLAALFDLSPRAQEFAQRFDLLAFEDAFVAFQHAGPALGGAVVLSAILALFSFPLLAGVALTAVAAPQPPGFVALLQGGIGWYGRMLRLSLVSLVPLAIVAAAASFAFHAARGYAERALLEAQASWAGRAAWLLTLSLGVLAHVTVEAARAELGADPGLRSAFQAWLRAVRRTLRRPLAVLGLYCGATFVSSMVAACLLLLRLRVSGASWGGFCFALLLTQLAVASIGWGKASRLLALTALARSAGGLAGTENASWTEERTSPRATRERA
jgi:hypothetical protein